MHYDASAAQVDADSRYLWRFPPRRLSAEEIRDTMLVVAGKLDRTAGGPGFRLYQYLQDNVATYVPLDQFGPETYRRSVYHQNARATRIDLMTEFDCPGLRLRGTAPRRDDDAAAGTDDDEPQLHHGHGTVPGGTDPSGMFRRTRRDAQTRQTLAARQVERAFVLTFARAPSHAEQAGRQSNWSRNTVCAALCRALLNSNELVYVY